MTTFAHTCPLTTSTRVAPAFGRSQIWYAPIVYMDGASPMTVVYWAASPMAMTAGTRYVMENSAMHYYLCTQSGTTSSGNWNFAYFHQVNSLGNEYTDGTAKYRILPFHGWNHAFKAPVGYWYVAPGDATGYAVSLMSYIASTTNGTAYVGADDHSMLIVGGSLVSCTKSAGDVLSTYAQGAGQTSTGNPTIRGAFTRGIDSGLSAVPGDINSGGVTISGGVHYDIKARPFRTSAGYSALGGFCDDCVRLTVHNGAASDSSPIYNFSGFAWDVTVTSASAPVCISAKTSPRVIGFNCSSIAAPLFATGSSYSEYTAVPFFQGARIGTGQTLDVAALTWSQPFAAGISNGSAFSSWAQKDQYRLGRIKWARNGAVYRSGGGTDGVGPYTMEIQFWYTKTEDMRLSMYNTKIDEGFDLTFYLLYTLPVGVGLTKLTTSDFWIEAIYLNSATTTETTFVTTADPEMVGMVPNGAGSPSLPTSTATWVGAPAGAIKAELKLRINARQHGPILFTVRRCMSAWSRAQHTGVWTDPLPTVYLDPIPVASAAP